LRDQATKPRFIQHKEYKVDERNMEAPLIVPSIHRGITSMAQDAVSQAIDRTPQTLSNRQAYDVIYPKHKDYYRDKRFFIFDKNYKNMESSLIKTFEEAVDSSINKKIKHVDELDGKQVNVNFDKVPRVIFIFKNYY